MPTPTNDWQLGTTYYKTGPYSIFSQPGGPFTAVLPALSQGQSWPDWPGAGSMVFSYGPSWIGIGCLHPVHSFDIIRDFDYTTDESVALLTCPACSYIQRGVEPFEAIYDPNLYCVIIA